MTVCRGSRPMDGASTVTSVIRRLYHTFVYLIAERPRYYWGGDPEQFEVGDRRAQLRKDGSFRTWKPRAFIDWGDAFVLYVLDVGSPDLSIRPS